MESTEQGPNENWDDYMNRLLAGRDQDMPLWMAAAINPDQDYWEGEGRGEVDRWSVVPVASVEKVDEWGNPFGNTKVGVSTTERLMTGGSDAGTYKRFSVIEIDDTEFTAEGARLAAAALIEAATLIESLDD